MENEVVVFDGMDTGIENLNRVPGLVKSFLESKPSLAEIAHVESRVAVQGEMLRRLKLADDNKLVAQNAIAEGRLILKREMGELTLDMEKGQPGPKKDSSHDGTYLKRDQIADAGLTKTTVSRNEAIASIPDDVFETHIEETKAKGEELTQAGVLAIAKKLGTAERKKQRIAEAKECSDAFSGAVFVADITEKATWCDRIEPESIDAIVTDPPYPRQYLPLLSDLSAFANYALKPGGDCFVMFGQSYLPEVYQRLGEHLDYYWTLSYNMPGSKSQFRAKDLASDWKPILLFTKGARSKNQRFLSPDVIDGGGRIKRIKHEWQQSLKGMENIMTGCLSPHAVVCDPFCGSGTTLIAAAKHGHKFMGFDIEADNVNVTKQGLTEEVGDGAEC